MLQYNPSITGSLIVTGSINASQGITGSLSGTVDGINVTSFSSSIVSTVTSVSSSLLTVNGSTGSYATTGSNTFTGAQTVQGTLTAQTLVVQTVTSSVDYVTGSTRFGSSLSNTHLFTGSVALTGSFTSNGPSTLASDTTLSGNESYVYFNSTYTVGSNSRAKIRTVGAGGGSGYGGDLRFSTRNPSNIWNEDAMIIDSDGKVGIGTTSPDQKLTIQAQGSSNGLVSFKSAAGSTTSFIGIPNANGDVISTSTTADLCFRNESGNMLFQVNGNERLRIIGSGNVLIGYNLSSSNIVGRTFATNHASGNRGATLFYGIDDGSKGGMYVYNVAAAVGSYNAQYVTFETHEGGVSAGERMRIDSSGRVGIGTSSPARTLDVTGTFRVVTPNRSFFITTNAYSISDGTLSSGIGMDGDGIYLGNVTSSTGWTISNPQVSIRSSGYVGIGTTSPGAKLDLYGDFETNDALRISGTYGTGRTYRFKTNGANSDVLAITELQSGNRLVYFGNLEAGIAIAGTTRLSLNSYGFTASVKGASDSESKAFMDSVNNPCGLIPTPAGTTLYLYNRSGGTNYRVLLTSSTYFTGQHGNKPINSDLKTNILNYIGMIVSSNGTYHSVNPITQEVTTGKDAIQISEALPEIRLTELDQDKAVWGVITNVKNDNYNTNGTIETDNSTEWGDRLGSDVIRINGLGEGAIWVTNINGNIENGDYLCSSVIPGFGRKQNDDLLHNYTVAKSTMDCDFDLNNDGLYVCEEFEYDGTTYKKAFLGCTYHCS